MPEKYVATDHRTGLEVTVEGEFPADSDERVRIARTVNLFARLVSTILSTEAADERQRRFRALETQLEVADAMARGDDAEMRRLARETLRQMGMTDDVLRDAAAQMREQIEKITGQPPGPEFDWLMGAGDDPAPDP